MLEVFRCNIECKLVFVEMLSVSTNLFAVLLADKIVFMALDSSLGLVAPLHFLSQDLISNSPYCLLCNSYDVGSENLVLDQLIIS